MQDENGYETIMNALQTAICRLDARGVIVYANSSLSEILSIEKRDIIGMHYAKILFGIDSPETDPRCAPFEFALNEGEVSHVMSETLTRPDSTDVIVEFFCVPLDKGGVVMSFEDVTHRREIEDALEKARDGALVATKTKSRFLANMSHEIRTPLTGIIGTAELLSGTELNSTQRGYVETLRSSTAFLHSIVNDVLDFSKLEAGAYKPQFGEIPVARVIEETLSIYRNSTDAEGVVLSNRVKEDELRNLHGDVRGFRQIINNLISNAVKFTKEGSIEVFATLDQDQLEISVQDSGVGVGKEYSETLFEPFEQIDNESGRLFEGSGLGLSICKKIVSALGGTIGFYPNEDSGSTFWFRIPVERSEVEVTTRLAPDSGVKTVTQRVLVVDDNPTSLGIAEALLKKLGAKTSIADSGAEAIRQCQKSEFDIVLLDCQMPEMDGYQTAIELKDVAFPPRRIVAFTASSIDSNADRRSAAGMQGILPKPFSENDLAELLGSYIPEKESPKSLDLSGYLLQHSISEFINRKTLASLIEIDSDQPLQFLKEILTVYVEHASQRIPEFGAAIEKMDPESALKLAHNLKGSSANLGVSNLEELFHRSESEISNAAWDSARSTKSEIAREFIRLSAAVEELVEEENESEERSP